MGPDGVSAHGAFSKDIPPAFDGYTSFAAYRQDVEIWLLLTTLDAVKRGPALVGRLGGEAKASAKSLGATKIGATDGATQILDHLQKSYGIDEVDQLDIDLALFFDFHWKGNMSIEEYIAGFHARLDKLHELSFSDKLKGHLLLRQAGLDANTRNVIVGSSSGNYDVAKISAALRQAFRNAHNPFHNTTNPGGVNRKGGYHRNSKNELKHRNNSSRNRKDYSKPNRNQNDNSNNKGRSIFYTYKTSGEDEIQGAIIDSGACTSVVGQETLDRAMRQLRISELQEAKIKQEKHRFGDSEDETDATCAVLFPFKFKGKNNEEVPFKIHFDVIPGQLPFLIGWPSLRAMKANLNCEYLNLGIKVDGKFIHIPLNSCQYHVYLPFHNRRRSQKNKFTTYYHPFEKRKVYRAGQGVSELALKSNGIGTTNINQHYPKSLPTPSIPAEKNAFDVTKLKKLHLALGHGTATAMQDWLKTAGYWNTEYKKSIEQLLLECPCKISREPSPHPIVSTNIPERRKQTAVSLDVVFFEGIPVMHAVDKCIGWSETSVLRNRSHQEQVSTFSKIWIHRHGIPKKIHADREYFRGKFADFCSENGIELLELAANDHEANGIVERANRTLRSFFRRLRSEKQKLSVTCVLSEATYAKNICKGSRLTSSSQLLYGQHPRILAEHDILNTPVITLEEHVKNTAKNRMNKLINTRPRKKAVINVGDFIFYWRDKQRWLGPARVVEVDEQILKFVHDDQILTSSFNRVQKTIPPPYFNAEEDEEDIPTLPIVTSNGNNNVNLPPGKIQKAHEGTRRMMTRSRTRELGGMDASKEDAFVPVQTSKKKLLPWESGEFNDKNTDEDLSASYFTYSSSIPITNLERIEAYEIEKKQLD